MPTRPSGFSPVPARAMLVRGAAKVGMGDMGAGLHDLAEAEKRGRLSARLCCEQGLADAP